MSADDDFLASLPLVSSSLLILAAANCAKSFAFCCSKSSTSSLDSFSEAEAGNSASEMSEAEIFRSSADEDSIGEVTGEGGRFWGVVDSGGGGKGGVVIPDSVGGNGGGGKGGGGGEGMPESSGVSGEPLGGDTSLTISSSTCSYTRFGGGPGGVRGLGGVWVPGGGGVAGAVSVGGAGRWGSSPGAGGVMGDILRSGVKGDMSPLRPGPGLEASVSCPFSLVWPLGPSSSSADFISTSLTSDNFSAAPLLPLSFCCESSSPLSGFSIPNILYVIFSI